MPRLFLVFVLIASGSLQATGKNSYLTVEGAGGVPLHVVTAGDSDKPPILLIHGLAQSHYIFHKQFQSALADDFFLVSFDLRGHGASAKPWMTSAYDSSAVWAQDVAAVMEATGVRKPLLVGWSFGTLVALDFIRVFGAEQVAGVVLTGAIGGLLPFRLPPEEDPDVAEFQRVREQQFSADPRDQVAASYRMVDWLTSAVVPEDERDVLRSTAMMFPAYARRAIYTRRQDNRDLLSVLASTPVLLALGADDNPVMLEDGASLAADYPNITRSLYENAGHSVFYEQAERFNRELGEFAGVRRLESPDR
ncbi:MAG: non-heme chloroperoxidase [Halieaceae bacterium]|jgi:non-heme chloroperoxidase